LVFLRPFGMLYQENLATLLQAAVAGRRVVEESVQDLARVQRGRDAGPPGIDFTKLHFGLKLLDKVLNSNFCPP
jgi:hypothetical protein